MRIPALSSLSHRCLTALTALAIAGPALTQDTGDDWDLRINPEADLIAASLTFDSGVAVGVRCFGGRYDALLAGLPEAPPNVDRLELSIQFGDEPAADQSWSVAINRRIAVSDLPARFARTLREGGRMQVVLRGAGADGANLRYVFDLPASSAAIDQTLEACDKPLVDPRDLELEALGEQGLPGGLDWADRPRPSWPSGRTYVRGFAAISCLTQPDGRLRDCAVESQHPLDGGFGESALRAARRGRIKVVENPDAPVPTRMIIFRTMFNTSEASGPPTGTRLQRD